MLKALPSLARITLLAFLPGCAPEPAPIATKLAPENVLLGNMLMLKSMLIRGPAANPSGDPPADIVELLREVEPAGAFRLRSGRWFVLDGDGFWIIGVQRGGVYLVTRDGEIVCLMAEWEVRKLELFVEGMSQPTIPESCDPKWISTINSARSYMIESFVEGNAIGRLEERVAQEIDRTTDVSRRASLMKISPCLHDHTPIVKHLQAPGEFPLPQVIHEPSR